MCVRSHAQIGRRNSAFDTACAFLSWDSMMFHHFFFRCVTFLRLDLLVDVFSCHPSAGFWMALSCDVGQCVRVDSNFIVNLNLAAALLYYMSSKSVSYVVEMFTTSSEILSSSGSMCMFSSFSKASLLLSFFNCTCCDLAPLKSLLFTTPIACAFWFITTGRAVACLP